MKTLHKSLIGFGIISLISAACAYGYANHKIGPMQSSKAEDQGGTGGSAILAYVNGAPIHQSDLLPLMQNGVDKTNALDRRISQLVLAQQAESKYASEATIALNSVKNDVLSQIYVNKRTEALRSEISDKEISDFYEKNVSPELFKQMKVKFKLFSDAKEAQTFFETLNSKKNDKDMAEAQAKLEFLAKQGDHFLAMQELPYNMGQVFKDKKAGDVLPPVVIREGILVSMLDEVRQQDRPALDKVKDQIRAQILNSKIEAEVTSLRKNAKIELKS